ncbi:MFS transporter [Streptomyces sp. NPDC021020]|uniref:MFS transporter n=1 Tax=Streptomyces sp. NPDC021020 TaxID=3365109 RepID=UPI0037A62E3F
MATTDSAQEAVTGSGDQSRPRAVLPALCATQITSWGVVYYAFPVLAPRIANDTGWPHALVTAAFSAALLVSAAIGIPVGRVIDRHGPRAVMTTGSAVGVLAALGAAAAPSLWTFTAAWAVAGAAMAATFYQPAFAALTRWYGTGRVRALTTLTLAGGLASTVFAPVTAALADHLGWRGTYLVLAMILGAITIPAHALALRAPWPTAPDTGTTPTTASGDSVARTRPFLLLTAALTLSGFAVYAVVITLIPLLAARGASTTTAAWALGLGGLGQTLGRTLYSTLAHRTGVVTRTTALIAASTSAIALLAVVPGPIPLLIAISMLAGMIRGNITLLQATAITDRWGTTHYAALSALLAAPVTIAGALAPFAGTALADPLGGYPRLFLLLAAVSALACGLSLGTAKR